jgi:3-oxoacyl-[acyl-carrier-protein] synthase I
MTAESMVVTGIGMRTPVGNDAVQTAAAVRAGIARFAAWEPGAVLDGAPACLTAGLPENYGDIPWVEKVDDLVSQPLHEALWDAGLYDFTELRGRTRGLVGAYLATPYPDRAGVPEDAYASFVAEAAQRLEGPGHIDQVALVAYDHASGLAALNQAIAELAAQKVDVALVIGIDSLLHSPFVNELDEDGFLKLSDRPHGLLPGEAAAVLVVERARDAKARKADARLRIGAIALDMEKTPLGESHPIRGEGASRAVNAALAADRRGKQIHRVITDMSGERWRALEWALVETRCLHALAEGWQHWHPADCTGDVGAASGVVHAALAARAFARGYAGAGGMLLFAASRRGERAAATLWPGGGS